jgi:hypothetical protein
MDKGEERKQLYGKAGACRIKSYGPEYRTLSNFWIFEERLIQWVWDNVGRALSNLSIDFDAESTSIQEAINGNNKDLAKHLVQKYSLEVV